MLLYKRKNEEYGIFRYAVLFSEIEGRLKKLSEKYKENMRFDVMGYSHEGRELFLVTLAQDVSDSWLDEYSKQRLEILKNPKAALADFDEKNCPPLPVLINCNLHGNEISGTDGMLAFIEEVLEGDKREKYLKDTVILISICLNPDGRSRGLDCCNGHGVDLNRDWIAQTQPETRALITGCHKKYYPTVFLDMHGYMSSGNIFIDPCTPPHNHFAEYDLLASHLLKNAREMAKEIKEKTNLNTDIPAEIWDDGWEDYCPIYSTGYFMLNGAVSHTIEVNFPSEEGAYVAHCAAVGMMAYVLENKWQLYKDQCEFYSRGIENKKDSNFHTDYYIIKRDKNGFADKTAKQLIFNGISVYKNETGDYVIPLSQPLRPLIHNKLWQGEDISDMINECYDIAFYSHTIMRGLDVSRAEKGDPKTVNLREFKVESRYFDAGSEVLTGLKLPETPENLHGSQTQSAHKSPRILVVTESGTTYEVLSEMGYDVDYLPFSELNTGWRIDTAQYDILVLGGTKSQFWEDPFEDKTGIGYQTSGGLWERGRREIISAAKNFKKLILFNYAGMKVNEELCRINVKPLQPEEAKGSSFDPENNKYIFNVSNGSFCMVFKPEDPLCSGYEKKEVLYLVAPLAFESVEAAVSIRFGEDSFINGFSKNKRYFDGHIAAFHKTDNEYKTVMFGFDPTYRGYTDVSFKMLHNAVKIVND